MKKRRLPPLASLRAFESAARLKSAKKAAEELSVTPTAVSHQIRQLEDFLGQILFERKPRQLVINRAGLRLQQSLSLAFDDIETTISQILTESDRKRIILSTPAVVASRWLLSWVCLLRETHPEIDLHIQAAESFSSLKELGADIAIGYIDGPLQGMIIEKLTEGNIIPICSPVLVINAMKDLQGHSLIHLEKPENKSNNDHWSLWAIAANIPQLDSKADLVVSDESQAISAALNGQGIALINRALVEDELENGRLIQPFGPELSSPPLQLIYQEARAQDPLIVAVREWIMNLPGGQCIST